jgi:hypothetical protein
VVVTEFLADLVVGFLLLLTTGWCITLYCRLRHLRVERHDLQEFIAAIAAATERAEAAIGSMREAAGEIEQRLSRHQELAQQRIAELARLAESGGRLARRLEGAVHQGARTMAEIGLARERPDRAAMPMPDRVGPTEAAVRPGPQVETLAVESSPAKPDGRRRASKVDPDLLRVLEVLR